MPADLALAAGQLLQLGYAPRPVLPNEKRPHPGLGDWRQVRSFEQVLQDFAGLAQPADSRLGILTDQLLVVDFDKKGAVDGEAEYQRAGLPALPADAPRDCTPSGGVHVYMRVPSGAHVRNSASKLAPGADVRARGGFVVIPPSPGYTWQDENHTLFDIPAAELPLAPPALLDLLQAQRPVPVPERASAQGEQLHAPGDREHGLRRARAYLDTVEPAVSGQGGHNATFRAACRACELVLQEDDAVAAMAEWNARCSPPWTDWELKHKVQDAIEEVGLGARFEPQPPEPRLARPPRELSPETLAKLEELNRQWFVLDYYGDVCVARHLREEVAQGETRERLVLYSYPDFKRKLETQLLDQGRRKRPLAEMWLEWSGRREYDRLTFDPSGRASADPGVLNLWRGWGVQPRPGARFDRIREHVEKVVCNGDKRLAQKLWGWMATLFQRPDSPGEIAVALRGREGVGKSVLGRILRRLCGQHGMAVTSPSHLVGNFNVHLRDLVFLEASEAVFAGDRAANSKLKALITDDTVMIEGKGRDSIPAPNRLHILMTTNESWCVPASADSRRYLVLDVSDKHRGDQPYFDQLWADVEDPEALGGLLDFLLHFDLSTYSKREVVETDALKDQREQSAASIVSWALDVASRGELETDKGTEPWRTFQPTRVLFEDFRRWCAQPENRFQRALGVETFSRELRSPLGLTPLRRAKREHTDVPPHLQGKPGYAMPGADELARLARKAGGFEREEEPEERPEGEEQAPIDPRLAPAAAVLLAPASLPLPNMPGAMS